MVDKLIVHARNLLIAAVISLALGVLGILDSRQIINFALPGIFIVISMISSVLTGINREREKQANDKSQKKRRKRH